jgi:hypothetical protein
MPQLAQAKFLFDHQSAAAFRCFREVAVSATLRFDASGCCFRAGPTNNPEKDTVKVAILAALFRRLRFRETSK